MNLSPSEFDRRKFLATASGLVPGVMAGGALGEVVAAGPETRSPFLQGIYAPVDSEIPRGAGGEPLKVTGKIPESLRGVFLRNGPNPHFAPKGRYHWFDGDGMIHGVWLDPTDSRHPARYGCRWVRTAGFLEEEKANKAIYPGLMEMPDLAKVALGQDGYKNAANTSLCWHQGKLLALWEGGSPHTIDPKNLKTIGRETFRDAWKGSFTAHPKVDPVTGEMVFFGYGPVKPYLRMGIMDAKGVLTRQSDIDLPRAIMIHDFAITPDYAVFLDLPQTFSFSNLALGKGVIAWEPRFPSRIGLIPRKGGKALWFPINTASVFHTLNAWQEPGKVILVACRMSTYPADVLAGKATDPAPGDRPQLYKYEIDIASGKVRETPLDDPGADMPRVADSRIGQPTRFGYTMETDFAGLRKHDLRQSTTRRLPMPGGWACGEPVFVPAPKSETGSTTEDDGHLVTLAQPDSGKPAELWIVDARSFDREPVARIHLPRRVPAGFHGIFLPAKVLG